MKVKKSQLGNLLDQVRLYHSNDCVDIEEYQVAIRSAIEMEESTNIHWLNFTDLANSILGGFKPDATNEQIYQILNFLGVEVVDEQEWNRD